MSSARTPHTGALRLKRVLDLAPKPEALLLDLDGVVADVDESYRRSVIATARHFGVEISLVDLTRAICTGAANNDWLLTHRLIATRGVEASLESVTAVFQDLYLGVDGVPGLRESEKMIVPRELLEAFAERVPLAIVTGRPRNEADWFLSRFGVHDLIRVLVALEDAPNKPDPAPVRLAMQQLGVRRAWMVGDTPDDVHAACAAGVLAIGVVAPWDSRAIVAPTLLQAGATVVLTDLADLLEAL